MQQLRSMHFPMLQYSSYHVPQVVGQPVHQGADPADELQVLGLSCTLPDEVEEEAGWDEGHGEDDADRHRRVHRCAQPGKERGGRMNTTKHTSIMSATYFSWTSGTNIAKSKQKSIIKVTTLTSLSPVKEFTS